MLDIMGFECLDLIIAYEAKYNYIPPRLQSAPVSPLTYRYRGLSISSFSKALSSGEEDIQR